MKVIDGATFEKSCTKVAPKGPLKRGVGATVGTFREILLYNWDF